MGPVTGLIDARAGAHIARVTSWDHRAMAAGHPTIWTLLEECVGSLSEPFRASEIIGWFRRHHPEVNEQSLRTHIQGATGNVSRDSRGTFATRTPLLTRIDHGL